MRLPILAGVLAIVMLACSTTQGAAETIPERLISDLQEDLGLEDFQAAAVAGNLAQETGNFTMLTQIGGPGLGYSQWNGDRRRKFLNYAAQIGDQSSYPANYGFLVRELRGPYAASLTKLKRSRTLEEATRIFMVSFLRPARKHAALRKRVQFAKNYELGIFDGAGCASVHRGDMRRVMPCPEA